MTAPSQGADIATASTFFKDATDVTIRRRILLAFLDEEGRVNRDFVGKDMNWLTQYKLPVAQTYTGQQLVFNNDNFNISASATPAFWCETSGMNFIDRKMNTGPTMIVDNFTARLDLMRRAMQIKLYQDLYSYAPTNPGGVIGIKTIEARSTTLVCTNADQLAVPLAGATYAGLQLAPGAYGGQWSALSLYPMSSVLGSDWPDGQGSADQLYDPFAPRLYNENTNRWTNPPETTIANGTWFTNCIAMLSRSNTDLSQNTVKTMMPNIHISGAQRTQNIKDALRLSYRDIQTSNKAAETLGYYDEYSFEGAIITTDFEAPADRTISFCAASMDLSFYGESSDAGGQFGVTSGASNGTSEPIVAGIFTIFGPERPAGSVQTVWIVIAGGQARYQPKWHACHKDFTTGV